MTTRHSAYVVVLADDVREDDAEAGVLTALRMVKGVADVQPVKADVSAVIARARRDVAWREEVVALLDRMQQRE